MRNSLLRGLEAGAVGTLTLNVATYLDMTIRARPASSVPTKIAGTLADTAGIDLAPGEGPQSETAQNRRSGLGALMGYVTGLGIGAVYGLARPRLGRVSLPLTGAILGLTAMAASDVPAVTTGATDLRTWGVSSWLADLIPHLAYGLTTAVVYETLDSR